MPKVVTYKYMENYILGILIPDRYYSAKINDQ